MRVLLDECVPARLARYLAGHDCVTVPAAGLAGTKNGELLSMAEQKGFQSLITIDRGIVYQQNFSARALAILVLRPKSSRLADLLPLVPQCLALMESIAPGELYVINP